MGESRAFERHSSCAGPTPLESRQIYSAKTWTDVRIVEVEYHGENSSRLGELWSIETWMWDQET
jgi:hypothetical protein